MVCNAYLTRCRNCRIGDRPACSNNYSDVTDDEDAPDTVIDLTAHFDDLEDGAAGLTYSVSVNDNTALVNTSILGTSLTLSYPDNTYGIANITIQATDSGGLTVDDTFTLTVNPVNDTPIAYD